MKKSVFEILELPIDSNYKIILFDGICNYCNDKVNYIIKKDINNMYKFLSIQSEKGQLLLKYLGVSKDVDSIVLYIPNKAYYLKSAAILEIAKDLHIFFGINMLFQLIPSSLRDLFYDWFAKNRYKWYGKRETCRIPDAADKEKFI